jgi:hypothetical protein
MLDHPQGSTPNEPAPNERPDPSVTPELFREWRTPRFGQTNPERMNNPVWEWLIRGGITAWSAAKFFAEPSAFTAGPGWCFNRFGQSSTALADGRCVLIAGEHEDHYDPDFCIYNDVVVRHRDGGIDIFGYPKAIFPPTDFHSATLLGEQIILIGSLGYQSERIPGTTQILRLDLSTFAASRIGTSGMSPGWLHAHSAKLSDDETSILVCGGKVETGGENTPLVENIDEWKLHLGDWRWERLSERRWSRWAIFRADRRSHRLWEIQAASMWRDARLEFRRKLGVLIGENGAAPDFDLAEKLYRPPLAHTPLPEVEGESGIFRIDVEGVIVRYVQDFNSIQMTVEGDLPSETMTALTGDLLEKLSRLENTRCELQQL